MDQRFSAQLLLVPFYFFGAARLACGPLKYVQFSARLRPPPSSHPPLSIWYLFYCTASNRKNETLEGSLGELGISETCPLH